MRSLLKITFFAFAFCSVGPSFAQTPRLKFVTETYNLDTLTEGIQGVAQFKYVHTGKVPLVLESYTTCGCTVADVPTTPVLPGDTGIIKITYNTTGRPGPFEKIILLHATAKDEPLRNQDEFLLKIKGVVVPAK